MSLTRIARWSWRASALLLTLALCGVPTLAQAAPSPDSPRRGAPPRTDAGDWYGTWWYVNRDWKVAIWIRETGGKPEYRLQFLSTISGEGFVTDWTGSADYRTPGGVGKFRMLATERGADTIRGTWNWTLDIGDQTRAERGGFTLYRAGHGRQLVLQFDDFEMLLRRKGGEPWMSVQHVWTFRKASKREVRWEELPF